MTIYVDFNQELALPDGQAAKYVEEHAVHDGILKIGTRFMWSTFVDFITYKHPELIKEVKVIDFRGVHELDGCGRIDDWGEKDRKEGDVYDDATYRLSERYLEKTWDPNCLTCTHHCQNFMVMVNHKTGVA